MAILRENGRAGAVAFALLGIGCLSTDEPLFRTVTAPASDSDPAASATLDIASKDVVLPLRPEDGIASPLGLAPPSNENGAQAGQETPRSEAELPPVAAPVPPPRASCTEEGLLLCETFEGEASGAFPATGPWLSELPGCGTHVVDESGGSVSGTKALRANSGGYPECMLHADLGQEGELYVRSWVRLGAEPPLPGAELPLPEEYLSLLELGGRETQDEPELRIGVRPSGGSLCANAPGLDVSVSGIGGGSKTDCSGVVLEPEEWYCLQAHVTREGPRLSISLAVDGQNVLEQQYERLGPGWNGPSSFLKLGQAAYGPSARGSVWHDDVAVGRQPLSCTP